MSTCKDCIHYELCKDSYYNAEQLSKFPLGFLEKENAEKNCAFFEDRSKFVDSFVDSSELKQNVIRPKTGQWLINSDGYYPYCSICKNEPQGRIMTDYCPNCGARMKEKKHE